MGERGPAWVETVVLVLLACVVVSADFVSASARASALAAAPHTLAGPPSVDVASYVVADFASGQILAEKAPHRALAPASTLKILTADALLPRLDAGATIDPQPADYAAEPDGSLVGVTSGVTYSVADLWRAAFLVSGNDAIMTLAHLAGGLSRTLALMRAEAAALGASDTVVVDPDGYDADGQVSSAYDLALMARAGLRLSDFRRYCGLTQASFPAPKGGLTQLVSKDPMLLHYPGMIGIKGGMTTKAGHTYVGAATRGGRTLIVTVMLGGSDVWDQVTKLLDWGFTADGVSAPVDALADKSPTAATTTTSATPATTTATSMPATTSTAASVSVSTAASTSRTTTVASAKDKPAPPTSTTAAKLESGVLAWQRAALAALLLTLAPLSLAVRRREQGRRHH